MMRFLRVSGTPNGTRQTGKRQSVADFPVGRLAIDVANASCFLGHGYGRFLVTIVAIHNSKTRRMNRISDERMITGGFKVA